MDYNLYKIPPFHKNGGTDRYSYINHPVSLLEFHTKNDMIVWNKIVEVKYASKFI